MPRHSYRTGKWPRILTENWQLTKIFTEKKKCVNQLCILTARQLTNGQLLNWQASLAHNFKWHSRSNGALASTSSMTKWQINGRKFNWQIDVSRPQRPYLLKTAKMLTDIPNHVDPDFYTSPIQFFNQANCKIEVNAAYWIETDSHSAIVAAGSNSLQEGAGGSSQIIFKISQREGSLHVQWFATALSLIWEIIWFEFDLYMSISQQFHKATCSLISAL